MFGPKNVAREGQASSAVGIDLEALDERDVQAAHRHAVGAVLEVVSGPSMRADFAEAVGREVVEIVRAAPRVYAPCSQSRGLTSRAARN